MQEYTGHLSDIPLFEGIAPDELIRALDCLKARTEPFNKGETILAAGGDIRCIGIILYGEVLVIREDIAGNRMILARPGRGDTFSEVLVCAGVEKSPVSVVAQSDTMVLFIDYRRIVASCTNACAYHSRLIENMLGILARKNMLLSSKITYLSMKSLRRKLSAFLLEQYRQSGRPMFEIPFDRNGLAAYLNADRSALSRELCRMRDEGILEFWKNGFKILDLNRMAEEK